MSNHDDLVERAEAILRWSKDGNPLATTTSGDRRPLFIEFAGTPKSGKSSCIESVRHFFHRCGYRVNTPSEGASRRNPRYLKADWTAFNAWSACYAISQVLESTYHPGRYDIAILDRGPFDAIGWFELLAERGDVDRASSDVIQQFLLLDKWRESIDIVALMRADPKDCMARENRDKLIEKTGRAMNEQFLSQLNDVYQQVSDRYSGSFNLFLAIDTSDARGLQQEAQAREIVDFTLGFLEAQMQ